MFEISGLNELATGLSNKDGVAAWARDTLEAVGKEAFAESQSQVPVRTGALRASGSTQGPEQSGDAVNFYITYGGGLVNYAWIVHEDVTVSHRNGKAHYLSDPVDAAQENLAANGVNLITYIFGLNR